MIWVETACLLLLMMSVITMAEGLAYSILIILMKLEPIPICSKTDQRYDHSSLSKAFSASRDNTAQGAVVSDEPSKICNSRQRLSEDKHFLTNSL